jgi:hypothetical protein
MKSKNININDPVGWKWMGRVIEGSVVETHFESIVKEIKGKLIKRNGSVEKPAYLVKSKAGNLALKLSTEIFIFEDNPLDNKLGF